VSAAPYDRLRLTALRYAVNDESEQYVAVMRVFTAGTASLLSDLSAREVADSLRDQHGLELDVDVVDARLSYLVNHGNLTRSPRETEAKSIRDYLTTRARYQLTQRGELVHRQVEELLAALPTGPRGARWLMVGCLREAHDHDPAATDVSALLPPGTPEELDRAAAKVGPRGVLAAGLICLDALGSTIAEPLGIPREELLGVVLPRALVEHDLLAPPADV